MIYRKIFMLQRPSSVPLGSTAAAANVCVHNDVPYCTQSNASRTVQANIIRSKSGRTLGNLDVEVREKFNDGRCEDSYAVGPVIGKGGFATVRRGGLRVSSAYLISAVCLR